MKVEILKEAFKYNPETGLLTRKISKPKVKAGSVALAMDLMTFAKTQMQATPVVAMAH